MEFRLADYGLVFSTRDRGKDMLRDLHSWRGSTPVDDITIDFAGVRSSSYSFVDEFVGELFESASPRLVHVPPSAARSIERSFRLRGIDIDSALADCLELA